MNEDNILIALGLVDKEDIISDLLVMLLKNQEFLNGIIGLVGLANAGEARIRSRISVPRVGVPDIAIWVERGADIGDLIIIENKILALESNGQTDRYASPECQDFLRNHPELGQGGNIANFRGIYLTLYGDEPAAEEFEIITYQDILGVLNGIQWNYQRRQILAEDLVRVLEYFHELDPIDLADIPAAMLFEENPLERNFLLFRRLMHRVNEEVNMEFDGPWRGGMQGRRFFCSQFYRDAWRTKKLDGKPLHWNDGENYNVHIEPQLDVLNHRFNLFVHHETNPYLPQNKLERAFPIGHPDYPQLEQFLARKETFRTNLQNAINGLEGWGVYNYFLQMAKKQFPIEPGETLQDLLERVVESVNEISGPIDQAKARTYGV